MSQHPEQRSKKSTSSSKSSNTDNTSSGHGNAREQGRKGGTSTHGRN